MRTASSSLYVVMVIWRGKWNYSYQVYLHCYTVAAFFCCTYVWLPGPHVVCLYDCWVLSSGSVLESVAP